MDQWADRVAVVTGASSGIGAAIVLDLCRAGVITIGLARRLDRVQQLTGHLTVEQRKLLHARRCDVALESDIVETFAWIEEQFGGCDILINNAGILRPGAIVDAGNTADIAATLAVNVMAVVLCTREAFRSMKRRISSGEGGARAGHVVLINSVGGHNVPYLAKQYGSLNVYQPSKHAITAMTEVLRQEFQMKDAQIKVTSISPGAVNTEIVNSEMADVLKDHMLKSEDISAAVMYVLGTPPHVQVHELTIKPMGEQFL